MLPLLRTSGGPCQTGEAVARSKSVDRSEKASWTDRHGECSWCGRKVLSSNCFHQNKQQNMDFSNSQHKRLSPGETDGATGSCEQADVQTGGRAVHRSRCVIFQLLIFLFDSVDEERINLALLQKYSIFPQKSSKWLWTLSFHHQAFTIQPNNFWNWRQTRNLIAKVFNKIQTTISWEQKVTKYLNEESFESPALQLLLHLKLKLYIMRLSTV